MDERKSAADGEPDGGAAEDGMALTTAWVEADMSCPADEVEEVEVIFGRLSRLSALDGCTRLRRLTMIETGLTSMAGLQGVSGTLTRLCLVQQKLERIAPLELPVLRDLLLQDNQIARIENLEGLPRLQRLWLQGNAITRMEGLHELPELKELWLHGNPITHISGLEHTGSLEVLGLSQTRITELKELKALAHLPLLRDLALADVHFGAAPVALLEGYREYACCHLRSLVLLDGAAVSADERSRAEASFMASVLAFNERLESVRRENEAELAAIDGRRSKQAAAASKLQAELLSSFFELERTVRDGRARIAGEHDRQRRLRKLNLAALEEALDGAATAADRRLDALELDEKRGREADDDLFDRLTAVLTVQRDVSLFLTAMQAASKGSCAAAQLFDPSPDYRAVAELVSGGAASEDGDDSSESYAVGTMWALFNAEVAWAFDKLVGEAAETQRLFYAADRELLHEVIVNGFSAISTPIVLFNTAHAALTYAGSAGTVLPSLLLCAVVIGRVEERPGAPSPTAAEAATLLDELPAEAVGAHLSSGSRHCYVMEATRGAWMLPQVYVLLAPTSGAGGSVEEQVEGLLAEVETTGDDDIEAVFSDLVSATDEELRRFEHRVAAGMDPEAEEALRVAGDDVERLHGALEELRGQIDEEKSKQEQLLREFRAGASSSSSGSKRRRPGSARRTR